MATLTIGLGIGTCLFAGFTIGQAVKSFRRHRAYVRLDNAYLGVYRRLQEAQDNLASLEEEVSELGPVLADGCDRWGFNPGHWPRIYALVGDPSRAAVSRWLVEHAPGIALLNDGGRATDTFFVRPRFTGWVPPQIEESA